MAPEAPTRTQTVQLQGATKRVRVGSECKRLNCNAFYFYLSPGRKHILLGREATGQANALLLDLERASLSAGCRTELILQKSMSRRCPAFARVVEPPHTLPTELEGNSLVDQRKENRRCGHKGQVEGKFSAQPLARVSKNIARTAFRQMRAKNKPWRNSPSRRVERLGNERKNDCSASDKGHARAWSERCPRYRFRIDKYNAEC